jgi:ribosomal protein S18 acetylase RimI-like enzyme
MMRYLIDQGQARGLSVIDLEVIDQNVGAYKLYLDLGFVTRRRLLILERPPADAIPTEQYTIEACSPAEALSYYDSFHDAPNAWQRSFPALKALANSMEGWLAIDSADEVVGYCVGWMNHHRVQLMDVAASPTAPSRQEVVKALLATLHHEKPEATGGILNVGEDDAGLPGLQSLGYHEVMAQYDMRLTL